MNVLAGLSTSVSVRVPLATACRGGVVDAAGFGDAAGGGAADIAASLAPWMVMVTCWAVPSMVVTVKVSVRVSPTLSACTVALASLSV